jgi:spore germination protein YaaH
LDSLKEKSVTIVLMNMISVHKIAPTFVLGALALFIGLPSTASAMEVAAWVPWFGTEEGPKSAIKNIEKLDVIYLFAYEVQADGSIVNRANFEQKDWKEMIKTAKENNVKVIPTVAWFDGEQIDSVLSDRTDRRKHIKEIVDMVEDNDFDGVNIDYEGKKKETKDDFSAFLKEINKKLDDKSLTCALEARTPADSLYTTVPAKIEYSNDYKVINKECDWVEIMAYDQQRADIKLNNERKGVPYMPVADKDWVEKVVQMAVKDIDKGKILLGVATYGRAWDVAVAPEWYRDYTKVASLNQPRIIELSKKYKSKIGRTAGGEATISYFPDDYAMGRKIQKAVRKAPKGTPKGFEAAARALQYATDKQEEVSVRFVTWSDSVAIKDKMKLAEKYHLSGIAIFKVDGEEDQKIWKLIK